MILRTGQRVLLTARAQDAEGNPATFTGLSWASSDPAVVEVTDNGDGTAWATDPAGAGLGTATVTATAQDDIGETLTGVLDIEVVAADAAVFNIEAGTPEPRPEAPPEESPPA